MAELDIEKLLFSDSDVDATPGDFELKFEIGTESTFSDDDLVEAIESYENSQNPSYSPGRQRDRRPTDRN